MSRTAVYDFSTAVRIFFCITKFALPLKFCMIRDRFYYAMSLTAVYNPVR